jgi:hypothetical protein
MKAENQTTGHNRTVRFTGVVSDDPKVPVAAEQLVELRYVEPGNVDAALALDHGVIPAIVQAVNTALAPRELNTVLAALRLHQHVRKTGRLPAGQQLLMIEEIESDDGTAKPLTLKEIDRLCERLNLGE